MPPCAHIVDVPRRQGMFVLPTGADRLPDRKDRVHWRRGQFCARVRSCSPGPHRHARAHAAALVHPWAQSCGPVPCHVDVEGFQVPEGMDEASHDGSRER